MCLVNEDSEAFPLHSADLIDNDRSNAMEKPAIVMAREDRGAMRVGLHFFGEGKQLEKITCLRFVYHLVL
jgi:hypothetical protein